MGNSAGHGLIFSGNMCNVSNYDLMVLKFRLIKIQLFLESKNLQIVQSIIQSLKYIQYTETAIRYYYCNKRY